MFAILKNVDKESLRVPQKSQINIKNQLKVNIKFD